MRRYSTRQRVHLLLPLVGIAAIVASIVVTLSGPRPDSIPEPRPLPAKVKGLQAPTHDEYDDIVDELEDADDGISDTQRVTATGITRDRLWAYVTATAPGRSKRLATYLLQREDTEAYSNWTLISWWNGGVHYRRCTRTVPRELRPLLVRDRMRCQ